MRRLWHGNESLIDDLRDTYGDAKGLAEASGPCLFDQDGEPEF